MKFSVLRLLIVTALVAILIGSVNFAFNNIPPKANDTVFDHFVMSVMATVVTYLMLILIVGGICGLSWLIEEAINPKPKEETKEKK